MIKTDTKIGVLTQTFVRLYLSSFYLVPNLNKSFLLLVLLQEDKFLVSLDRSING